MKNGKTELVFILDRSGSMAGLVNDTIGGFNSMIDSQKLTKGDCLVTTVLFDTRFTRLHDRVPLQDVKPLTREDYVPGGCTALLDAMGDTIRHVAHIHKYSRREDVPENVLFVITTDGLENASHRYSAAEIRKMVDHEQEKYGWQFLFLGANIDAFSAAESIGIRKEMTSNFMADSRGMASNFQSVDAAVAFARKGLSVDPSWRDSAMRDYEDRKN